MPPTISVIIDKNLRDSAQELLRQNKRTMTHLIHETLKKYVAENQKK